MYVRDHLAILDKSLIRLGWSMRLWSAETEASAPLRTESWSKSVDVDICYDVWIVKLLLLFFLFFFCWNHFIYSSAVILLSIVCLWSCVWVRVQIATNAKLMFNIKRCQAVSRRRDMQVPSLSRVIYESTRQQ